MTGSSNSFSPGNASVIMTKHHGLGNDFLIAINPNLAISDDQVRLWCDRRLGFGADGLIVGEGPDTENRWRMWLRNADGSRAAISGNGIRCLGQAIAMDQELDATVDQVVEIDTDAGLRRLDIRAAGPSSTTIEVRVAMGRLSDGPALSDRWASLGVDIKDQKSADIGNPHLVGFVDDRSAWDMAVVGPGIEADYPDGCNIHLVDVVDPSTISMSIWERGVGITLACGSGACAASWAAHRLGFVDSPVTVIMPGGSVTVELTEEGALLTGPSTCVGEVRA